MTGITGYTNKKGIRTFGKLQLKEILEKANFKYTKFYYPLPDYKLPNIIFSEKYKPDEDKLKKYTPYLSEENTIVEFDEKKAYEEVIKNNQFEFFANSFFIEASMQEFETKVNLEKQDLIQIDDITKEFYNRHFKIKTTNVQENTKMKNKMIDILIATYNGEKYIAQQIDSILNQSYKNIRLVISDDNSTDSTREILKKYENNERVEIYLQQKNLGYIRNFEFLLKQVKNELYMLSDQDDVWLEEKVEKSVELLEDKDADLVFSDLEVVDKNLNVIYPSFNNFMKLTRKIQKEINNYELNYLYNCVTGCTILSKKKLIDKILPIPHKSKYVAHDHWIALMVSLNGKVAYMPEKYIKYRQHGNNQIGTDKISHKFTKLDQVRKLFLEVKLGIFETYVENNSKFPEKIQELNEKAYKYYKMLGKKRNFNFRGWGIFHKLYKNETFIYYLENFCILNLPLIGRGAFKIRHMVLKLMKKR